MTTTRKSPIVPIAVAVAAAVALVLVLFGTGSSGDDADNPSSAGEAGQQSAGSGAASDDAAQTLARRVEGDPVTKGDIDAPVVLVAYSEFQCPFCGKFARDTVPTLEEKYVADGHPAHRVARLPLPRRGVHHRGVRRPCRRGAGQVLGVPRRPVRRPAAAQHGADRPGLPRGRRRGGRARPRPLPDRPDLRPHAEARLPRLPGGSVHRGHRHPLVPDQRHTGRRGPARRGLRAGHRQGGRRGPAG